MPQARGLPKKLRDRPPTVGGGHRPVSGVERFGGIAARSRENGGKQVGHRDRLLQDLLAELVGGADRLAGPQPAAGEHDGEGLPLMATPSLAVEA